MLKILQARLQQYMNCELQMFKLDLEKVEEPEIKWPKPLTVWITTNWKILKEMGISDHLTCLLRNLFTGQEATVKTRWNNGLILNWERSTPRLYIFTLLI